MFSLIFSPLSVRALVMLSTCSWFLVSTDRRSTQSVTFLLSLLRS